MPSRCPELAIHSPSQDIRTGARSERRSVELRTGRGWWHRPALGAAPDRRKASSWRTSWWKEKQAPVQNHPNRVEAQHEAWKVCFFKWSLEGRRTHGRDIWLYLVACFSILSDSIHLWYLGDLPEPTGFIIFRSFSLVSSHRCLLKVPWGWTRNDRMGNLHPRPSMALWIYMNLPSSYSYFI